MGHLSMERKYAQVSSPKRCPKSNQMANPKINQKSFLEKKVPKSRVSQPVHPNPWHDRLCHHKPPYIFPQNSHHTYLQGISIAFLRYIDMQHLPSHDFIFMSYMLLA